MKKAMLLLIPSRPAGIPSTAENSNDRMSVAQKEWSVRGRFLMPRISKSNESPRDAQALSGGVALVTGASRGIGRAIAHQLALLGASVSICGRDRAALKDSASELAALGVPVHNQIADVTNSVAVFDMIAQTEAALGPITILVNNAGIGLFGPVHEKTEADWDRVLDTNLKSVFPRFSRGRAFHDSPRLRRHHQHQFPGRQKHVRRWRHLLRLQVGSRRSLRLYG